MRGRSIPADDVLQSRRRFFRGGLGVVTTVALARSARADDHDDKKKGEDDGGEKAQVLEPLGDGRDDWPRLLEAARACAYKRPLTLTPGRKAKHWLCKSTGTWPSGVTLVASGDVLIQMSLPVTGRQRSTAFCAAPTYEMEVDALVADVAPGSNVVSVRTPSRHKVGSFIQIANATGLTAGIYQVLAIVTTRGSLTVDRPIRYPFRAGHPVASVLSFPRDIRILGNGMRITGTGDRAIEFIGAVECLVHDVHYDTSGGGVSDSAMSFDIGCRECEFVGCTVDMTGAPSETHGILLESNEKSRILDCHASNCGRIGIYMVDSSVSSVIDSHARACKTGFWIGTDEALGNFDCDVVRCSATECVGGIGGNLATRTTIIGFSGTDNSGAGISLGGCVDTLIVDCASVGNAYGLLLSPGTKNTTVRRLDVSGSKVGSVIASDDIDIDGLVARNITIPQTAVVLAGGMSRLTSFEIESTVALNGISCAGGSAVVARGTIRIGGNQSIALYVARGVLTVSDVSAFGSGAVGVRLDAGATLRAGANLDLTRCERSMVTAPGSYQAEGNVNSDGVNSVKVIWPDIKASDIVALTRTQANGTPGATPTIAITEGTGFSIVADENDTSTYRFRIVNTSSS